MGLRWLVTGGCGFIGQEVVSQLQKGGHDAYVFDLCTSVATGEHRVEQLTGGKLWRGSVCDPQAIEVMISRVMPDVVLHLAAQSHVDQSLLGPSNTWMHNAMGTQNVAEKCTKFGVPMVYCSTDEVYGTTPVDEHGNPVHVTEDAPLDPSSPYSASKAAGEHAVRAMGRSAGLKWAITRGSNAFGPHQFAEKLIPITCGILNEGGSVPLHGGGNQFRQWVHVEDFARALILVGTSLYEGGAATGETFNIAGPEVHSVRSVVLMLAEAHGLTWQEAAWDSADRPGQDLGYAVSGDKLHDLLGWRAGRRLSDASEIAALWEHYTKHHRSPRLAKYVS